MISFKKFVTAIQDAIVSANDAIMDRNVSLLDKYFTEEPKESTSDVANPNNILIPKSVVLEYPHLNSSGAIENLQVAVPLITLVPLTMSKVEKAFLSAHFEMQVVDDEVQLNFTNQSTTGLFSKKPKTAWGKIEFTFSPQETAEGFKLLVAGYEDILKRQMP